MATFDDAASCNIAVEICKILIEFQIEQNKKAEADSQAAKPKKSATAETLAEDPQAKGESTTKKRDVKN